MKYKTMSELGKAYISINSKTKSGRDYLLDKFNIETKGNLIIYSKKLGE